MTQNRKEELCTPNTRADNRHIHQVTPNRGGSSIQRPKYCAPFRSQKSFPHAQTLLALLSPPKFFFFSDPERLREGAARKPLLFHFVLFFVPFRIPHPPFFFFFAATRVRPAAGLQGFHGGGGDDLTSHCTPHHHRGLAGLSQWATRTAAGAFRRPSHRPPIVRHLLQKSVNQASSHTGLANRPRGRGPARQPPGA